MTIALDIEQPQMLIAYLREMGYIQANETPQTTLLTGGVSNRTVLVTRESGEGWVVKQALEKLRVAVDWFSSPERVHREAAGLRELGPLLPTGTIPALIFEDHEHHLLAMQAVPEPHANWKELLLAGQLTPEHVIQFGQILGTIHQESSTQQATIAPRFADRSFFETLRLEPYYAYTATQTSAAAPFLTQLIEETRHRKMALVHGDYSPKNVLVYENRLVLLDYEVIHWGDPAFDLGFSLTHLLSKAHHLPALRHDFATAAQTYWQSYLDALGDIAWREDLEPWAVRHTLACLLARVAGRSPLEYLLAEERQHQQRVVVTLMEQVPDNMEQFITEFVLAL